MLTEIRHAARRLRRTPVVTLSAVACLSIGVWMTCIMSALALGIFRPNLHIRNPDRVVQLDEFGLYATSYFTGVTCCGRYASRRVFDSVAKLPHFSAVGYYLNGNPLTIEGDQNWHMSSELSSGMMTVLNVVPILGRVFIPADDTVGGVVLIGERLWRTRYGSDSAIVGKYLRLKGEKTSRMIVGVLPRSFVFPRDYRRPEIYLPPRTRMGRYPPFPAVQTLARLADGVDVDDAEVAARAIATRSIAADRAEMTQWFRTVSRKRQPPTLPSGGVQVRLDRYLTEPMPASAVGIFVLILACGFAVVGIAAANVINLLLVRGAVRRPEIAVRMAMGASRMRVVRELIIEAGLLAVPAIAVGLTAANRQWATLDPSFNARHMFGEVDLRVGMIAMLSGAVLTLLVGVWPALRATSFGLEHAMRDARRSGVTASPLDGVLGRLVAASTAVTVILLIAAVVLGLSARDSFQGVAASDRATLSSALTFDDHQPAEQRLALARETLTRLRGLPGVATAALGLGDLKSLITSTTSDLPSRRIGGVEIFAVSDGYFEAMSIPILRGRGFSVRETRDSIGRVVISRAMANKILPGRDGVGDRFRYFRFEDSTVVDAEVIGVVEDVVEGTMAIPQMYLSLASLPLSSTNAVIRYRRGAAPQPGVVTTMLRGRPGFTASTVVNLAEKATRRDPTRSYVSFGFTMFAVVALVLAIIGMYGVVAYSVVRRTHEIGVRMALGAEGSRVTTMVIEHGMRITLVGLCIGLPLSIGVMKGLSGFVQDVSMNYPAAIGGVIAMVVVLSFVASAIPALRAGRLNPVDALRAE
jgi:putative ABC transport system permease protein